MSHSVVGALHLVTYVVTGKLNVLRKNQQGRAIIFPKRTATTLLEGGRPEKIHTIDKGTLFNLMPTDILNVIDIWIFGIEYIINIKAIVT